jgi:hypothetical protein
MTGNVADVVGYFVWLKTPLGGVTCEKIDKDIHDGKDIINKQHKLDFAARLIGLKNPLTEEEFKLTLEQLAVKYPCPKQTQQPSPEPSKLLNPTPG